MKSLEVKTVGMSTYLRKRLKIFLSWGIGENNW